MGVHKECGPDGYPLIRRKFGVGTFLAVLRCRNPYTGGLLRCTAGFSTSSRIVLLFRALDLSPLQRTDGCCVRSVDVFRSNSPLLFRELAAGCAGLVWDGVSGG